MTDEYLLWFRLPAWISQVAKAERRSRLTAYFRQQLEDLKPWLEGVRVRRYMDATMSALIEADADVTARLQAHLKELQVGGVDPAGATFPTVTGVRSSA